MIGLSICSIIYYVSLGLGVSNHTCLPRSETVPESNIWIFFDGLQTSSDYEKSNGYHNIGDNISFRCEYNLTEDCEIFWTQTIGDVSIDYPSHNVRKYSISVTLDRFDNASIWNCVVCNNTNGNNIMKNLSFEIKLKPDKDEIQKYYQNANVSNECDNGTQYTVDHGKIKPTNSNEDNNICISQIADSDPTIANYRRRVTYKTKPFLTQEEFDNFVKSTQTTGLYDMEDNENPEDNLSLSWKAGLGAGLLIPVIAIIVFTVMKSHRKRRKSAPEGLATANEVEYAEIIVNEGSANYLQTSPNAPYAQVIGVLMPKRQNVLAS